ncbi:MAG: DUF881 domain-containing protein [Nocardioidaceae bacterium]
MPSVNPPPNADTGGVPGATPSGPRKSAVWRVGVPLVCVVAGLLGVTSMVNSQGTDLRGGRHTSLIGIVGQQRSTTQALQAQAHALQTQVDALNQAVSGKRISRLHRQFSALAVPAGLRALAGPGITVTLDDSPKDQQGVPGVDPNLLVVHQQDIQAVVNALWAGGADGVSLQGERIISTTGVKCVGNTVVLQGVPYSPPYRIVGVGNIKAMYAALLASPAVRTYREYVNPPYDLGWQLTSSQRLVVPAFRGPLDLEFARPPAG